MAVPIKDMLKKQRVRHRAKAIARAKRKFMCGTYRNLRRREIYGLIKVDKDNKDETNQDIYKREGDGG